VGGFGEPPMWLKHRVPDDTCHAARSRALRDGATVSELIRRWLVDDAADVVLATPPNPWPAARLRDLADEIDVIIAHLEGGRRPEVP